MRKNTNLYNINATTRKEVLERDKFKCILCGDYHNLTIAHFIPKSRCGLGIKENLVVLCMNCHHLTDHTEFRDIYLERIADYLSSNYKNWEDVKLTTEKGILYAKADSI